MPRSSRGRHIKLERLQITPKMCGGKRVYANEKEALLVKEEQELLTRGLNLRVYKCIQPGCRGWHLTRAESKFYN